MAKKTKPETDISTEEKIKEAARKVFSRKGYAATRTRDIAEEANINLALLNYYFRSKEKLFELVMLEKMQKYFGVLVPILNDASTTLETKTENIAARYIDLILDNPDLPLFVLSELRNGPVHFIELVQKANLINDTVLIKQLQEKRPDIHPLQFLVTLLGMCVFPFLMRPVLQKTAGIEDDNFEKMMLQRKTLIPVWTKAILEAR